MVASRSTDGTVAESSTSKSATQPSTTSGAKRKARESLPKDDPHPEGSTVTRSTRRSGRGSTGVASHTEEPTRGEEENLIGYDSMKRARISSPKQHDTSAKGKARQAPRQEYKAPVAADSLQIHPGLQGRGYPFGLTPYRYACLIPDHPPPPPGDPKDPKFQRFDPLATTPPPDGKQQPQTTTAPMTAYPGGGSTGAQTSTTAMTGDPSTSFDLGMDYGSSQTSDAAFESLSALLAASQEYGGAQLQ